MAQSSRVRRQGQTRPYRRRRSDPQQRPLKIFTLDSTSPRIEGAIATIDVPWEPLEPGPSGSVIFVDPPDAKDVPVVDLERSPLAHQLRRRAVGLGPPLPSTDAVRGDVEAVLAVSPRARTIDCVGFRRVGARRPAENPAARRRAGRQCRLRSGARPDQFRIVQRRAAGHRTRGAERPDLHVSLARRHRARDDTRADRRLAIEVHHPDVERRHGLSRRVCRSRRGVPALHLSRGAREAVAPARRGSQSGLAAREHRAAVRRSDARLGAAVRDRREGAPLFADDGSARYGRGPLERGVHRVHARVQAQGRALSPVCLPASVGRDAAGADLVPGLVVPARSRASSSISAFARSTTVPRSICSSGSFSARRSPSIAS